MRASYVSGILACFCLCNAAVAEEEGPVSEQEIVVTASAEPSEAKQLPAFVQVITGKEMQETGIHSLEEALTYYVPGSGNNAPGALASVGMRGFRSGADASSVLGDRVLLLIDGLRASSGNPNIIPFALVERIEIVRGPSSVLYGGSAMGGVVNVITRRGQGDMHGELDASYGRFDTAQGRLSLAGSLSEKWGMALSLGSGKSGNYKSGDGEKYPNTHSANSDMGGTFTYSNENTTVHTVALHRSLYDLGSPGDRLAYPTPKDRLGMHYTRFSSQLEQKTDAGHIFNLAVYGDDNRYKIIDNTYGGKDSVYKTLTLGARAIGGFSLGSFGRFSLGVDYANIRDTASGTTVYQPDMRTDAAGLFAEYRYEGKRFSSFSGVRYDAYNGKVRSNAAIAAEHRSKNFEHVSWNTGAVYWLTDWLGLKANVGTAFVAPTAKNLVGRYYSGWSSYVGNPDLEAETSLTAEGGLEVEYEDFRAEVMYFQTWYKDRIAASALVPYTTYTWKNIDSQRLDGVDFSLSWRKKYAGVTISPYAHSELFTKRRNGDGSTVTNVPHHSTVAGLGLGYGKVWLDVNARFTGTQKDEFSQTNMGDYTVVNAKLTVHATDALDVYCGVNNLTDRLYAVTYGYPLPGRAVYGGFTYKF